MTMQVRKNATDIFIDGVRRGFTITTTSPLPNMVMALVTIQALKVTGLLEVIRRVYEPAMTLWGLSGEPATMLLAVVMSIGSGVGVCASLVVTGALSRYDAMVLLPVIYLMGNPVQNVGRCLGTAGAHPHYYPLAVTVCIVNALLSIWVVQAIVW